MARTKTDRDTNPDKYFTSPQGHPRDRIIIHENMEIPKEGVYLALNGFSFLAKPGVEIDLPRPVREMLDTRIKTELIQDEAGEKHERDIPRITYTLIQEDVQAEPDPFELEEGAKE